MMIDPIQFEGNSLLRKLMLLIAVMTLTSASTLSVPPYTGTIFVNNEIIEDNDRTTYKSIRYKGQNVRRMFDRRVDGWRQYQAYLFDASFNDSSVFEVQVNPEFKTKTAAHLEAKRYSILLGKLPKVLRHGIRTVAIHQGNEDYGGGNDNILIHTGRTAKYKKSGIIEETLFHEAVHTSMDKAYGETSAWRQAQRQDNGFISDYALRHPEREDLAESFLLYYALKCKPERLSSRQRDTIRRTIPNRIEYFDVVTLGREAFCPRS